LAHPNLSITSQRLYYFCNFRHFQGILFLLELEYLSSQNRWSLAVCNCTTNVKQMNMQTTNILCTYITHTCIVIFYICSNICGKCIFI
jgi:hypothetical protein